VLRLRSIATSPGVLDAGFFLVGRLAWMMLEITVNGVRRTVPTGSSVQSLLELLQLKPRFLAVEVNRRVVPRGEHGQTILAAGDQIEIVTLVGGG
jgi:thiamine biosynthesis protein ThiS